MRAFLLIIPLPVAAFDWHPANQVSIAWDAVTVKDDGSALADTDVIEYSVYV
ncbi:MAG: hypothetical protein GY850_08460 [bacterium]|nr:hypothetical protein [bacterium]